jgi:predicted choloylglycine hydrolase
LASSNHGCPSVWDLEEELQDISKPLLVNVIIATTKWSKDDLSIAVDREKQLREQDILFKPALEKQARLVRHDNTRESAHQIISSLLTSTPLPLQIQQEMVEMGKPLRQTTAGTEFEPRC